MKNVFAFPAAVILSLMMINPANAARLDVEKHNQLIQKLESVVGAHGASEGDAMLANSSLILRLADLYSERSRVLSIEEQGQGDQIYKSQIESDRKKALSLYKKVYNELESVEKNRVDMQSAHLLVLLKRNSEAEVLLKKVALNKSTNRYKYQAMIDLGDLNFSRADYKEAQKYYQDSLKFSENSRKSYVELRLSWCVFNQGQYLLAEQRLTELLRKNSSQKDSAFQEEASRDLATFMSRNQVNEKKINLLKSVSPANVQQSNLVYLAEELDRTSKKQEALLVWAHTNQKEDSFMDKVEKQVRITRIQYDIGDKNKTVAELKKSLILLKDDDCEDEENECEIQRHNLRSIITDWGKAEERKPSVELVLAYSEYLKNYEDFEMAFWAGNAAMKVPSYNLAFQMFKSASTSESLHKKIKESKDARFSRILEGSFLSMIESAELSKDKNLRLEAYKHYIDENPSGSKFSEVRYQLAKLYYDAGKYENSSPIFRDLSLSPAQNIAWKLRDQSSDLYFDTLVLQKEEQKIEEESLVFAENMKSKRETFLSLWRKSILNQTATTLRDKNSSESQMESLSAKLAKIDFSVWPVVERKKMLNNKMLLAYRLKDISGVESAATALLKEKNNTPQEKNQLYKSVAWCQEMRFEFAQSLQSLKKMNIPENQKMEMRAHQFKMALLAELSNKDASPYFNKVLTLSKSNSDVKAQYAAHQLILKSQNPTKLFSQYYSMLLQNPVLFASATMRSFESNPQASVVQKALRQNILMRSSEGLLIGNSLRVENFKSLLKRAPTKSLAKAGDYGLKKALDQRLAYLKTLEGVVTTASREQNITLQFAGLTELANGNRKIANEILSLPLPRGLKAAEKELYKKQLSEQVAPYIVKSEAYLKKAREIWGTIEDKYLVELSGWSSERKPGSRLAAQEMEFLRVTSVKLGESQEVFKDITLQRRKTASKAQELQQQLQKNPFNSSYLEELLQVQTTLGSGPMLAYLNHRLGELQSLEGGRN